MVNRMLAVDSIFASAGRMQTVTMGTAKGSSRANRISVTWYCRSMLSPC